MSISIVAEQFFEAVKAVGLEVAGICLVLAVFELLSCIIRLCKDTNDIIIKYQGCASLSIFYLSTEGAEKYKCKFKYKYKYKYK